MGCSLSTYNETYNEVFYTTGYTETRQQVLKRKLACQSTNNPSSSGFYIAFNSPSSCDILDVPKLNNLNSTKTTSEDVPCETFEKLNICDGYGEKDLQQRQRDNQDTKLLKKILKPEAPKPEDYLTPPSPTDLEMEMYMVYQSPWLMPKTSSPVISRRHPNFDAPPMAPSSSDSYENWVKCLQNTSPYKPISISKIPEAITGQFSPMNFPGFTDLRSKRIKTKAT